MPHFTLPGQTIGILGSGQLGRMLALKAREMGYRIVCYSPDLLSPLGPLCDDNFVGDYDDISNLESFARQVQVVTLEFENIPAAVLAHLSKTVPVFPGPSVLATTQNRILEKQFLSQLGVPVAPYAPIQSAEDLPNAFEIVGAPAVLKTAGFGYDGKGQAKITSLQELEAAFSEFQSQPAVLERWIDFTAECSLLIARGQDGEMREYPLTENIHQNHILDISIAPARFSDAVANQAKEIGRQIAQALDMVGILAIEFFVLPDNTLLVNELAPRPHNSGHWTIEGAACSQFEQHIRAVCGLPLGETTLRQPTAMTNLLGDLWQYGQPSWSKILALPNAHLHLYGKFEARPGRKMGHITLQAASVDELISLIPAAKSALN